MKTPLASLALLLPAALTLAPRARGQCAVDYLVASDAATHSLFGQRLAARGDVALVGAELDDERGPDAGAAYVLEYVGGTFQEVQKLLPPAPDYGQHFGRAVAVDGDRLLVGSEDNQAGLSAGAGFLYQRTDQGWRLEDTLFGDAQGENLGASVDLEGERAVLGAIGIGGLDQGYVVVFERGPLGWAEVARLHPAGPETVRGFGATVALSGDRVLVGANYSGGGGAAYLFERDAAGWQQRARLVGQGAAGANGFGHDVALEGERAVLAMPHAAPGRAWVFERAGGVWVETDELTGSGDPLLDFGGAVDLRGDRLAVGGVDLSAFGIAEEYVELFRPAPGGWQSEARVVRAEVHSIRGFGADVALWRDSLLVGSPYDAVPWMDAGAVHLFNLPRRAAPVCDATPNSTGAAATLRLGCGATPSQLPLVATPVPDGVGVFLVGSATAQLPAWDGVLCAGGVVTRLPVVAARDGELRDTLDADAPPSGQPLPPGSAWTVQAWFRDVPAGGTGANFSSAVRVTLGG